MFCRNCARELVLTPGKTCAACGANPVKAAAFCRYCGKTTSPLDIVCPTCGAVVRPIPASIKALYEVNPRRVKLGKIINLSIVVTLVSLYIIVALPRTVTKSIQSGTSDLVLASTGYTAVPLESISATPFIIPLPIIGESVNIAVFTVNQTQQLTINALYLNTANNGATGTGRYEDVTANCTYQSSNEKITTVTADGLVLGVAPGTADITVSYTAVPGSANISSVAQGKVPITITMTVPVIVSAARPIVIMYPAP